MATHPASSDHSYQGRKQAKTIEFDHAKMQFDKILFRDSYGYVGCHGFLKEAWRQRNANPFLKDDRQERVSVNIHCV